MMMIFMMKRERKRCRIFKENKRGVVQEAVELKGKSGENGQLLRTDMAFPSSS
jgi:hypothetical protein